MSEANAGGAVSAVTAVTLSAAGDRYELVEEGKLAFADVERRGDQLIIPHVEAAPELRGKGTAGRLMEGIVAHAEREGLTIVPLCSYARAWLARHHGH
jgi:predicted GNAT family acetyltransferase